MNYLSLENLNLFKNRVRKILGLQDDEIRTIVNKQTTEVSDDSKMACQAHPESENLRYEPDRLSAVIE